MAHPFDIVVLMTLTVLAGIAAQVISLYLRVPSIVLLLLLGIALGPDGINFLHPELLGDGLEVIVSLSVALILFEGGLQLQIRELMKASGSLRNLITLGSVISLLGGSLAAHYLGHFPWKLAFLYSALVIVTGPTVIGPLLKQVQVDRPVAALLEGEGVIIDPLGAIIAVLVLNVLLNGDVDPTTLVAGLFTRITLGAAIGGAGGWLLGWFLRQAELLTSDLKTLVTLAGVWGIYVFAQYSQNESGLGAAVVAGIVLSAQGIPELRLLRRFQGQLTVLAVSVLFILLAADLPLARLAELGWGGLLTVLALMLLVRPLNVWLSTWTSDFNWRQKAFISWIGPKGIVSASVASLFAIVLTNNGIAGGEQVKALVFLTIMITVVLQGLSAQTVANALGVTAAQAQGAVIVGSNALARLLARLLQERDQPVVLIDPNPAEVAQAKQENLQVFLSSALNTEVLEAAGLEAAGTFLAMTLNGEANFLLGQRVVDEFNPPRVLVVAPQDTPGRDLPQQTQVQLAFTPNVPLTLWNHYLSNDETVLVEITFQEVSFSFQQTYLQALVDSGRLLPLLVERDDQIEVAQVGISWQTDQRIIGLLQNSCARALRDKLPGLQEVNMPPLLQDLLKQVGYFEHCSEAEIEDLMAHGHRLTVAAGQIICQEQEPGESFFIILSGSVEIYGGETKERLATRYFGEFFGEISPLMGVPRTASARALENTTLFEVNKDNLQSLLSQNVKLADSIAEELLQRQDALHQLQLSETENGAESERLSTIRKRLQTIFSLKSS